MKKQSLKTTSKKVSAKVKNTFSKNPRENTTMDNFKSSVLVVSLLGNAFILVGWLTMLVTNQYDQQIATFLFSR